MTVHFAFSPVGAGGLVDGQWSIGQVVGESVNLERRVGFERFQSQI
jgi:hypothetical protein